MKRFSHLSDVFNSIKFCEDSIMKAAEGKYSRKDVSEVVDHLNDYAKKLQEILVSGNYESAEWREEVKWCPTEHKFRDICDIQFFPDRCVHWAVV